MRGVRVVAVAVSVLFAACSSPSSSPSPSQQVSVAQAESIARDLASRFAPRNYKEAFAICLEKLPSYEGICNELKIDLYDKSHPVASEAKVKTAEPSRRVLTSADRAAMGATTREEAAAYNSRNFIRATSYISDSLVQRCGGAGDLASALSQNLSIERLVYDVERVRPLLYHGKPFADVTFSSHDPSTGQQFDKHLTVGLHFARDAVAPHGWVLRDVFPVAGDQAC